MQNPKFKPYATRVAELELLGPPKRIVSLVPSITEALFALGLGERVVGVTDWCVHPAELLAGIARVGGTKNPRVATVQGLSPDLVIANHEENRRIDVERLCALGITVWVSDVRSVSDAVALFGDLKLLGANAEAVEQLSGGICTTLRSLREAAPHPPPRVFCAIWKNPWMGVGADTYCDDIIASCGGQNICAGRGDSRYPEIDLEELVRLDPEVILLPNEPYVFEECDRAELLMLPTVASRRGRIHVFDGTLLSWYGPRIERGLRTIAAFIRTEVHGS